MTLSSAGLSTGASGTCTTSGLNTGSGWGGGIGGGLTAAALTALGELAGSGLGGLVAAAAIRTGLLVTVLGALTVPLAVTRGVVVGGRVGAGGFNSWSSCLAVALTT